MPRISRLVLLSNGLVFVFVIGFFFGANFCKPKIVRIIIPGAVSTTKSLDASVQPIYKQDVESFSFAYNKTHLWSLRLADENSERIARLVPCRSVEYKNFKEGPNPGSMNACDKSTRDEFSVEATIHAQKWLFEHQNPTDCTNKRFALIHNFAGSGFGSTIHQIVWAFARVLAEDRIAIYQTPGNWLYGGCQLGTPDCLFLPLSNCSASVNVDGQRTTQMSANVDHWYQPVVYPTVFRNRSLNWIRSQLLFYIMRYNPRTLAYVHNKIAENFHPPSIDFHRPYIAIYVRRSDKISSREMSEGYSLQKYFDLFDADAHRANIRNVFINSEDEGVFNEFEEINKHKTGFYKLLKINVTRNTVLMTLLSAPMERRVQIILEFLTGLYIEAQAELHAGTLTSNWCRMVDEIRLTLGKIIPFYTPENTYLVDI